MSDEQVTEEQTESVKGESEKEVQEQEIQEQEQQSADEVVPKAELSKVLDDMHKYKKMTRELESKLKDREMSELREKENWQKIAEIKEKEALEATERAERLQSSFLGQKKYDALKQSALKYGIRQDALRDLELIDFDNDVAIETTSTGKINILGADSAIKKLKSERPYWFGKSIGKVNSDVPESVQGAEITLDKLIEIQSQARSSGNWKAYEAALAQYNTRSK